MSFVKGIKSSNPSLEEPYLDLSTRKENVQIG